MSDYYDEVFVAALENRVDDLKSLLATGARPREKYEIGEGNTTTLMQLVTHKNLYEVASLLLRYGVDINTRDSNGMTALHTAAMNGNTDIAELFLQHRAKTEVRENQLHETPLHLAARNGDKDFVSLLLEHGANREAAAKGGITPLLLASHGGHSEIALLLSQGNIGGDLVKHILSARDKTV